MRGRSNRISKKSSLLVNLLSNNMFTQCYNFIIKNNILLMNLFPLIKLEKVIALVLLIK